MVHSIPPTLRAGTPDLPALPAWLQAWFITFRELSSKDEVSAVTCHVPPTGGGVGVRVGAGVRVAAGVATTSRVASTCTTRVTSTVWMTGVAGAMAELPQAARSGCPDLVIVDEVHTAARASGGEIAQQRHELLRDLSQGSSRHLLLLTATPHSGVEDAFRSLLELLDPVFSRTNLEHPTESERRHLARHFVQRRRADVQRWLGQDDVTPFPVREARETTYTLARSSEYQALFDDIYAFARELVRDPAETTWRQRVRYWTALASLPAVVKEHVGSRFATRPGAAPPAEVLVGFEPPTPEGVELLGRTHPLTERLAEYLLDLGLDGADPLVVSRCGAMRSTAVGRRTTLLLLRLRLLIEASGQPAPALAEELIVAGFEGRPGNLTWLDETSARGLLDTAEPAGNLTREQRDETLRQTLGWLPGLEPDLNAIAQGRAVALLESHRRVRQATHTGRVSVRPHLPLDLIGLYVLLPVPKGVVEA